MNDEVKRIVETLRYCEESGARCEACPSGKNREGVPNCHSQSHIADLIERMSDELDQAQSELETFQRKYDAAVDDLERMGEYRPYCETCIYINIDAKEEPCKSCCEGYLVNNWYWRGLQDKP